MGKFEWLLYHSLILLHSSAGLLPISASEVYVIRQVWYGILNFVFFTLNRDAPLYLEWAPGNILIQNVPSDNDVSRSVVVGERDAKRMLLEQQVEGISDTDIDPDRVEVCLSFYCLVHISTSIYATYQLFLHIYLICVLPPLSISYSPPRCILW